METKRFLVTFTLNGYHKTFIYYTASERCVRRAMAGDFPDSVIVSIDMMVL